MRGNPEGRSPLEPILSDPRIENHCESRLPDARSGIAVSIPRTMSSVDVLATSCPALNAASRNMWKFTKYGFFSIGRVKTSYGIGNGSLLESINPDRLYIRARWNEHLTALQLRFAQLSTLRIEQT